MHAPYGPALAALALLALALLSAAHPVKREASGGPQDLETIMNNTVCPIKVDIDYDESRVPKRIKVLKCGGDPDQWCAAVGVPAAECCHHSGDNMKMQCVEVQDLVQVYYPKQDQTQLYRVSIGCTCVMQPNDQLKAQGPWR